MEERVAGDCAEALVDAEARRTSEKHVRSPLAAVQGALVKSTGASDKLGVKSGDAALQGVKRKFVPPRINH